VNNWDYYYASLRLIRAARLRPVAALLDRAKRDGLVRAGAKPFEIKPVKNKQSSSHFEECQQHFVSITASLL